MMCVAFFAGNGIILVSEAYQEKVDTHQQKGGTVMKITDALREVLCTYGLNGLFDRILCGTVLAELAPDCERERSRIQTAFTCQAMDAIKAAIQDVTCADSHFERAERLMVSEADIIPAVAAQTIYYFKRAFGFPSYREYDKESYGKISEKNGSMEVVYEGELKDGKPSGICTMYYYSDGVLCRRTDSVWVHGKRNGYCKTLTAEGNTSHREGFLVNDAFCGIQTVVYDNGTSEKIACDSVADIYHV